MTKDKKPATRSKKSDSGEWVRMWFKTNKVWMAVDQRGHPKIKGNKVLIKYQLKQDYEYWVNRSNVRSIDSPPPNMANRSPKKSRKKKSPANNQADNSASWDDADYQNTICVYTDGASSGNPGPSGIGILLRFGEHEKEISKFIGKATNNIAELKAIQIGLSALKNTDIPIRLFTDSSYAYGLLVLNWKPRKNQEIVESIKKIMAEFKDLKIIKIKGHAGHPGNEKADFLATSAIKKAGG